MSSSNSRIGDAVLYSEIKEIEGLVAQYDFQQSSFETGEIKKASNVLRALIEKPWGADEVAALSVSESESTFALTMYGCGSYSNVTSNFNRIVGEVVRKSRYPLRPFFTRSSSSPTTWHLKWAIHARIGIKTNPTERINSSGSIGSTNLPNDVKSVESYGGLRSVAGESRNTKRTIPPMSLTLGSPKVTSQIIRSVPDPALDHWRRVLLKALRNAFSGAFSDLDYLSKSPLSPQELVKKRGFTEELPDLECLIVPPEFRLTDDEIREIRDLSKPLDVEFSKTLVLFCPANYFVVCSVAFYLRDHLHLPIVVQFNAKNAFELAKDMVQRKALPDVCVLGDGPSLVPFRKQTQEDYLIAGRCIKLQQRIVEPSSLNGYEVSSSRHSSISREASIAGLIREGSPLGLITDGGMSTTRLHLRRIAIDAKGENANEESLGFTLRHVQPHEVPRLAKNKGLNLKFFLWTPIWEILEELGITKVVNLKWELNDACDSFLFVSRKAALDGALLDGFRHFRRLLYRSFLELQVNPSLQKSLLEHLLADNDYIEQLRITCGLDWSDIERW